MQSSPPGFRQLLLRRAEKKPPCGFYLYTWNGQRMSEKSITRTFPVHSSQCDALTGWHSALAAKCSDARYRFPTAWVSYTPHSERVAVYSDPGLLLSRHYHLATVFIRRVWRIWMRSVTLGWCMSLRSAAFPTPPVDVAVCRITERAGGASLNAVI